MQEHIKRLAVEAGFSEAWVDAGANPPNHPAPIDLLERFAQAVARECMSIVATESSTGSYKSAARSINAIRARFGLEG